MQSTVAWDLDGTLWDFWRVVDALIRHERNITPGVITKYECEESYGLTKDEMCPYVHRAYELWEQYGVDSGTIELLEAVYRKTEDPIRIVTARPLSAATPTHEAVKNLLLPEIPYALLFCEGFDAKLPYLQGIHFYVEDRRMIARYLAEAGITVFVPRRTYNRGIRHKRVFYIDGLGDLLSKVDMFTGG